MSLTWVIIGTIGQLVLAGFLFMFTIFSAGGIANNNESLGQIQNAILVASIYLMPLSCLVSAGIVIYFYNQGASANTYWINMVPILLTSVYVLYTVKLNYWS